MLTSENLFALFVSVPYALSLSYEHIEVSTMMQSKSSLYSSLYVKIRPYAKSCPPGHLNYLDC